ncbi:J domain-containing protein [Arthrobacter sp. MI7-26]|uniref:J domain-containing protein n=1 Tax=Arthrobacter sp. MI7-26 TaxID=2993653 RepID=UPI002248E234|nr:J domain-containing protein [Arthrobacter sp. MI7-26]MCX2749629.1 J domain-containing protein [Arthrobacter sp. MI7-26]
MKEHNPDPYKVLHLDPAATGREINHAYRALVRAHHPDTRTPGAAPAVPDSGPQQLRDIMDAYALLRDPVKRAEYDRQRQGPPPEALPTWRQPQGPFFRSSQRPSGAALIIGPAHWETPRETGPQTAGHRRAGHRFMGSVPTVAEPPSSTGQEPPRPDDRILWWILH